MKTWQKLKNTPALWDKYFLREKVITAIRSFFETRRFHEVETPMLIRYPAAESYLEVFETDLLDRQRNKTRAYLSTSPELALKKLIVAGIGNCYSITKSFRNTENQSESHLPEFTILEWYRVGDAYERIMKDCQDLLLSIASSLGISGKFQYQHHVCDLNKKWERISVAEAFQRYAHIDLHTFFSIRQAKKLAKAKGYTIMPNTTWEELYNQIFLNEIEPHIGKNHPTILYGFPSSIAALAKKDVNDPRFARRFELYIEGLELADCYEELTDWQEQKSRFEKEMREIQKKGHTMYEYDHDFIEALRVGMPETSGIALGIDRLCMLFANTRDINDTTFFPPKDLFEK